MSTHYEYEPRAGPGRMASPEHSADYADLIGAPLRVVVGKRTLEDGAVDVRDRATGQERRVAAADIAAIR